MVRDELFTSQSELRGSREELREARDELRNKIVLLDRARRKLCGTPDRGVPWVARGPS